MTKPYCQTLRPWLRDNLGKYCLAPLTSTDSAALDAAVQIVALTCYAGERSLMAAFGEVVLTMQPSTRYLAYHAIAHVRDWPDRPRIWRLAGLPQLGSIPACKDGPQPQPLTALAA